MSMIGKLILKENLIEDIFARFFISENRVLKDKKITRLTFQ